MTLDDDVAAAVERLRREDGVALSTAVNLLVRRGLAVRGNEGEPFVQRTSALGVSLVPLDDIGATLALLEGDEHGG